MESGEELYDEKRMSYLPLRFLSMACSHAIVIRRSLGRADIDWLPNPWIGLLLHAG